MHLTRLTLTHFRNYRRLELDFSRRFALLQGRNAQGKTNLLEAIYFLATSKSSHTRTEKEVVGWDAATEPIPYCQITGVVAERWAGDRVGHPLHPQGGRRGLPQAGAHQRGEQAQHGSAGRTAGRPLPARGHCARRRRPQRAPPLSGHRPVPDGPGLLPAPLPLSKGADPAQQPAQKSAGGRGPARRRTHGGPTALLGRQRSPSTAAR